ncbi:MAG TPA: response regulator [Verrucomicrobiae bacterium]|nr:response regulator [Verrucomicrobiae bacterium]
MASPTILLVDDDVAVLALLSNMLNRFGYVVAGASNSQAAIDYVTGTRNRFDAIVTDLAMPGINGMEFLALAKKTFPDVPVMIMTGHMEQRTIDEALHLGAFAYLTKPLDFQEFTSTIERALRPTVKTSR